MELQTAKGVRDIPPEEKIVQNKLMSILKDTFELHGFSPLETPILERYETLAAKFASGEESDALKETFKLEDQGGRKLALRNDLTVPLARYVAMNPILKMPFKRYEMGIVFRDGPIKTGRSRQFWQCDADTMGSKSMLSEAEFLSIMQKVFDRLNLEIIIKINNRKLLNGILEQAGIKEKEEALTAIDKLDKIGKEGVAKEFLERGYKQKQVDNLFELVRAGISVKKLKSKIKNEEGKQGILELEEVFNYAKQMGVKDLQFEVSLVRGQAYYTGSVFEAYHKKGKVTSSLAGGGRWDQMIGEFLGGNREVPAVGVSFGLVPIMECLKEKEKIVQKSPAQVYVIPIKKVDESLKILQQLREAGINADFDLNQRGVSKNLEYAGSQGITYVIIIGEEELKKKKVLLKDMNSGAERLLSVKDVIKNLNNNLNKKLNKMLIKTLSKTLK